MTPFALDLGAAVVTVKTCDLYDDSVARALMSTREIILDPRKLDGQNILSTIWHEVFHQIDDLYLGGWLGGRDDDSFEHKKLDVLANVLDMVINRNWEIWQTLYGARNGI